MKNSWFYDFLILRPPMFSKVSITRALRYKEEQFLQRWLISQTFILLASVKKRRKEKRAATPWPRLLPTSPLRFIIHSLPFLAALCLRRRRLGGAPGPHTGSLPMWQCLLWSRAKGAHTLPEGGARHRTPLIILTSPRTKGRSRLGWAPRRVKAE